MLFCTALGTRYYGNTNRSYGVAVYQKYQNLYEPKEINKRIAMLRVTCLLSF